MTCRATGARDIEGESDAQVSRPPRGVADRVPDGRGDAAHLRGGRPSLRRGPSDPWRAGRVAQDRPLVGAGALHLHVRVDGQVRRRVRRAHRHPRRRRRDDQSAAGQYPQALCAVRPPRGRHVHRDRRHAGRDLRMGHRAHRFGVTRPRSAEVDRLPVHSARLVPDVLPLPAGGMGLRAHRRAAAP